jgi:hypothetical protein
MTHQKTVLHWAVERVSAIGSVDLVRFLLDTQASYNDRMADRAFNCPPVTGRGTSNAVTTATHGTNQVSGGPVTAVNHWSGHSQDTILHVVAAADGEDDEDDSGSSRDGSGRDNESASTAKSDRVGGRFKDRHSLRLQLVNLLLSRGADTCTTNAVGYTPAQLARRPEVRIHGD